MANTLQRQAPTLIRGEIQDLCREDRSRSPGCEAEQCFGSVKEYQTSYEKLRLTDNLLRWVCADDVIRSQA